QLLLNNDICGTFSFDSSAANSARVDLQSLSGNASELLIRAVQMRDEFAELRDELRAAEGVYRQATSQLLLDEISPELAPVVRKIWNLSLTQPISVDALYRQCEVCEPKVYRAVSELLRTGQFETSPTAEKRKTCLTK
ncbi:MAG TPA: hypothetical protein VGC85_09365, partial [Chthoniobacterales bacterium]